MLKLVKIFTLLGIIPFVSLTLMADSEKSLKDLNLYVTAGYVNNSQNASQYLNTNTQGTQFSVGISPFKSTFTKPFRFALDITLTQSDKKDVIDGYYVESMPTMMPYSIKNKKDFSSTIYSFAVYYDFTKVIWDNTALPNLYFGLSYGKGHFNSHITVDGLYDIHGAPFPIPYQYGKKQVDTGPTVTAAIFGGYYNIYRTVALFGEYRYNYSIPPNYMTSKYVQGIPDSISSTFSDGKILKDYTSHGFIIGLKYNIF